MDKNKVKEAVKQLKESSKKRKFKQSFDLIVNLKGLNMKKPEQHVDIFAHLHHSRGKNIKVCAFVGPELRDDAKTCMDATIFMDEFEKYMKDKKALKNLANNHAYFIAQANIMPKVAQTFGKVLGTRGKMPNPKAGCVVPPKTAMKPLYDDLQKTVQLKAKAQPVIKCLVGSEEQNEDEVADNIMTIYNTLVHKLPNESHNIKNILLKLTMGKPVRIDK